MNWNSGRLWLRIIVYGSLTLLVTAVLAQSLIFWQFNEAAVRRSLCDSLRDSSRVVRIEGSITPRVFPFPGLDVNRITISQAGNDAQFARIERMEARLAWWPLLFGKHEVRSLKLYDLDAQVERRRDGSLSINDLFARRPQQGFNINLNTLVVRDSRIEYRDLSSGGHQRLEDINLKAEGLKNAGAKLSAGALLADEKHPLRMVIATPLTIQNNRVNLTAVDAQIISQSDQFGQTQLRANGQYFVDLNTLSAGGDHLTVAFSSERPQSDAKLTVPHMDASLDQITIPQAQVDARLQYGQSKYQLNANLNQLNISKHSMKATRLNGDLTWQVGENKLRLTLEAPFSLANMNDLRLAPLDLTARAITPVLPRGQLLAAMQGELDGDLKQNRLALHGKGSLDGSDIALDVVQSGWVKPHFIAALSIGALDLNRYLPETKGETVAILQNAHPIPLDWLDFLDLTGTISAGELSFGRFRMKDVSASVVASPRELELNQISANIYSGHLQGNARLRRDNMAHLEMHQTLSGMNIRPLLMDLFSFAQLDGSGSGQVSVTAQGQSFIDLRNSLSGNVQMSLNQGALSGIDLVSALKNLPAELKELNAPARANQKTTFSTLSASFQLGQGVGRNQDLKLASQLVNVSGGGKIDLKQNIIDYNMDVMANPREFASLKGVNIPLKITGPLNAPIYALDFNALVKGKKTETEKQQALKQELKKQITTILP
jgi:AsmA protein